MNNEKREQQTIKAAHEYIQSDSVSTGNEMLAFGDFINGAKWADSHPQWIPVEEELPKENERIIAYNGVFNEIHLCDFHDGIFEDFYGPFDGTITHWMPLPTPPQRKEK